MARYSSKYTIELWTRQGTLLADLSRLARNRTLTLSRNYPDDLRFDMDLDEFEAYCAALSVDPKNILVVGSVEVRIRRLESYLSGGQLVYRNVSLTANGNTVSCQVAGFLALFAKRFTGEADSGLVSEVYTDAEGTDLSRTDLLWSLINQSQSLTNGDLGITRGTAGGAVTEYDKQFGRTNLKDAIQNTTELKTAPLDIEFTHDKVFNTYAYMGSNRPDIVFEYPGNIISLNAPVDGTDIANEVIAQGRGAADGTQVVVVASDTSSQATYGLRQEVIQADGTDNSDGGITDAAERVLAAKRVPINVPSLVVDGTLVPYVTDYGIGDRVTLKVSGHPLVSDINGTYRIEKMTLKIDDNDGEQVTLEVSEA